MIEKEKVGRVLLFPPTCETVGGFTCNSVMSNEVSKHASEAWRACLLAAPK